MKDTKITINNSKDDLKGKSKKKTKSIKKPIIFSIIGIIIVVFAIVLFQSIGVINATNKYNAVVDEFNKTVNDYTDLTKKGQFDSVKDMPEKMEKIKKQNSDLFSAIGVVFSSNSKEKIEKDTSTLKRMVEDNKRIVKGAKQIISPKQSFVIDRLSKVEEIDKVEAVTKKNDPNGLLNKKGGYTSCVYYTTNLFDESKVTGKSIVSKGTDGGGAVEVFDNLKDAQERCKYLASFDGTVLTTGSYTLVGTMVIRTSYRLDNDEQIKLTDGIIKNLTRV